MVFNVTMLVCPLHKGGKDTLQARARAHRERERGEREREREMITCIEREMITCNLAKASCHVSSCYYLFSSASVHIYLLSNNTKANNIHGGTSSGCGVS